MQNRMLSSRNPQPQMPAPVAEWGCACPSWHAFSAFGRRSRPHGHRSYTDSKERASIAKAQAERQKLRAATLERTEVKADGDKPQQEEVFVWRKNWFPVAVVNNLQKDKPSAVTILNQELVLWWGEDNAWHAAEDRCPHKLAPMSEGRMDNGVLECRYHGWQFGADGGCVANPQASEAQKAGSVGSPTTCLRTFPTQEEHGMLWVWPQTGADALLESTLKKPCVFSEAVDPAWGGAGRDYIYFKSTANWSLMLENAMDPTHAASLHEPALGRRTDMVPMWMKVEEVDVHRGVTVTHNGFLKFQHQNNLQGKRRFIPPHTIRTEYDTDSGFKLCTAVLVTPEKPGSAHIFGKFVTQPPRQSTPPGLQQLLRQLPTRLRSAALGAMLKLAGIPQQAVQHAMEHGVPDQDMLMLHHCDRMLAEEPQNDRLPQDWRKYRLASQADTGVSAFWRWVEGPGGGDVDWAGGVTSADLPPKMGREGLFDHYARHTQFCSVCKQGISRIDVVRRGLRLAMGAVLALAVVAFSNSLAARATSMAAIGVMYAVHEKLAVLRERFFKAEKLPDEA